jgi:hypothetical protein
MAAAFDRNLTDRKRIAEVDMGSVTVASYKAQLLAELDKSLRKAPATLQAGADLALHDLPGFQCESV